MAIVRNANNLPKTQSIITPKKGHLVQLTIFKILTVVIFTISAMLGSIDANAAVFFDFAGVCDDAGDHGSCARFGAFDGAPITGYVAIEDDWFIPAGTVGGIVANANGILAANITVGILSFNLDSFEAVISSDGNTFSSIIRLTSELLNDGVFYYRVADRCPGLCDHIGALSNPIVSGSAPVQVADISGTWTHRAAPVITVAIDIKPGSSPNSINPKSKEVIPVAILTTNTFDATTVDSTTVLFGKTGTEAAPVHSALEDIDGDGATDMILHFKTQNTGILCGNTSASLTGETFGGQMIEGSDSIKTVGCK